MPINPNQRQSTPIKAELEGRCGPAGRSTKGQARVDENGYRHGAPVAGTDTVRQALDQLRLSAVQTEFAAQSAHREGEDVEQMRIRGNEGARAITSAESMQRAERPKLSGSATVLSQPGTTSAN